MANARDLMADPDGFLRHLRKQMKLHGISQQKIADASLLTRFHVNRIVRGHVKYPRLETLMKLSAALDILLYGEAI